MSIFFFFNDTATTEIYTLSLHDALPISSGTQTETGRDVKDLRDEDTGPITVDMPTSADRKSTRLNSSHLVISYAVFCLKKKKLNPLTLCRTHTTSPPTAHSRPTSLIHYE